MNQAQFWRIRQQFILLFCLSFLHTCLSVRDEIRLGMLSPRQHIRLGWEDNAAAATIAIDRAQSEGVLSNYTIRVIWRDDQCGALGGAGSTLLLKEEDDVDVFIGPPCSASTKASGLLASFWNLPMFSPASTDPILGDKTTYKTLVRLGPPFNKLGKAFVEIFRHYKWSKVVVISRRKTDEKKVFCDYSSRSLDQEFRAANITVVDRIEITDGLDRTTIDDILSRIQQRSRIVILCTENKKDLRQILLRVNEKGMANGDYVIFVPNHLPPSNVEMPWVSGDESDVEVKKAFSSVFQITVSEMAGPKVEAFRDLIPEKMALPPWNFTTDLRGSLYSPFLHDVVYLYLLVLNETLADGDDPRNGTHLFHKATGKTFEGITGTVKVDTNGDRDPDYWLWDLDPNGEKFKVKIEVKMTSSSIQKFKLLEEINWGTVDNRVPLDTPECGFFGEHCTDHSRRNDTLAVLLPIMVCLLLSCVAAGIIYYRRFRLEQELRQMPWKINFEDIVFQSRVDSGRRNSWHSLHSLATGTSTATDVSSIGGIGQIFSNIATCKGSVVSVRSLPDNKIHNLTRADQLELKAMRDLAHANVNNFVGFCLDNRFPCLLTTYCYKGSIQDIIENEDIKLDWMFKFSLIRDIVTGLHYIHESPLKLHGNLKSSNCVVDNRWVAKLTDFGMTKLRRTHTDNPYELSKGLLWTAPEVLRTGFCNMTKPADIYSLGIVMYEIAFRREPYDMTKLTPQECVDLITTGPKANFSPMRPDVAVTSEDDVEDRRMIQLIQSCWEEAPDTRPNVSEIKELLRRINNGNKKDIVDNMLSLLEKYASNLEGVVQDRTQQLIDEKKKTDMLLYSMLPPAVAERLKLGQMVKPELFDSVTIFFSDIVGFTSLCSESTPLQVVNFLNDLYTCFDSTIAEHDVYKVETIGDAYMVVSGAPLRNDGKHAEAIADMALDLLSATTTFKIRHRPTDRMQMRAGIHTGPCAAGVVGQTMPRYCLFGDTVNTASRMESNGEVLKIHVSEESYDVLRTSGTYLLIKRGEVSMKGKGLQTTYWLMGKHGYRKQLPPP